MDARNTLKAAKTKYRDVGQELVRVSCPIRLHQEYTILVKLVYSTTLFIMRNVV